MHVIREKHGIRCPGKFEFYWKKFSLALKIIYAGCVDEDRWPWILHFHFLTLSGFVHFPFPVVPKSDKPRWERDWQQWGVSHCDDALLFYWNDASRVWWIPWLNKVHQRHEVRCSDGSWAPFVGSWEQGKEPDGREEREYQYTYTLKRG